MVLYSATCLSPVAFEHTWRMQASVAEAAGAAAALIFDSQTDDYYLIQADAPSAGVLNMPVLSIPRHTGQILAGTEQVLALALLQLLQEICAAKSL